MRLKRWTFFWFYAGILLAACTHATPVSSPLASQVPIQATLVLMHGTLIDGTGQEPIPDAMVVLDGERIVGVGPTTSENFPENTQVIDLEGATILPGFINAHVHDAYDETRLKTWAQAGVTTVRDVGILSGAGQLTRLIALRNQLATSPEYARLVSAGYMLSVPGGYGQLDVTSIDDATQIVNMELDAGTDLIKLAMELGYAGISNLPNFSQAELNAIVSTAHQRGRLVSAHITEVKFLQMLLDAGVDDLAHIPNDFVRPELISQLIEQDVYVVPTLTVFEAYGGLRGSSNNLGKFVKEGVQIAMGNDFTAIPQNNFDHFDLGMPMHEIMRMSEAGMTPMQIIVASTRNAAHVSGLDQVLGTIEVGKLADILVIDNNPLEDLSALTQVKMVIHSGVIIRK